MTEALLRSLPIWQGEIQLEPLSGGLTNLNYRVVDGDRSYSARAGQDNPALGISRADELACATAAAQLGITPAVAFSAPGVLVCDFVEGATTLTPELIQDAERLRRIVEVLRVIHSAPPDLTGDLPVFCPFDVSQSYLALANQLDLALPTGCGADLGERVDALRSRVRPSAPVFTHNDMMPGNFLDTGDKVWVIDWEYSGMGHPLFDLAGLASNCDFDEGRDQQLVGLYGLDASAVGEFKVMKAMAALRESLWAVVQRGQTEIDFDYDSYCDDNYRKFVGYERAAR